MNDYSVKMLTFDTWRLLSIFHSRYFDHTTNVNAGTRYAVRWFSFHAFLACFFFVIYTNFWSNILLAFGLGASGYNYDDNKNLPYI